MPGSIELARISIETGSPDREGRLALRNGDLVAVIVRLDRGFHGRGGWFVEWAGRNAHPGVAPVFETLDEVRCWLETT